MRRALLVTVAVLLTACSAAAHDPYPLPSGPPHAGQTSPALLGRPTRAVLIYLHVRPGDRIELLGAEAIGSLDGASIRFLLSRPVIEADGTRLIGANFEGLAGAVVTAVSESPGPDDTVGLAAELTATQPGRYEVTGVRLRYRLNGGDERTGEGIDVVWTVCADDPVPVRCE
jgi:hypothetical protein